jgi:nitrite reductase/ring-hydroxylating ferredoxin subunit
VSVRGGPRTEPPTSAAAPDGFVEIGHRDDFPEGKIVCREVAGRKVAVVRWADAVYAVNSDCPHQGGPLCDGHVGPRVLGTTDGSIDLDRSAPTIACGWHGWEFDLRDGASVWDSSYRLRTFATHVADGGQIFVNPRRKRASA